MRPRGSDHHRTSNIANARSCVAAHSRGLAPGPVCGHFTSQRLTGLGQPPSPERVLPGGVGKERVQPKGNAFLRGDRKGVLAILREWNSCYCDARAAGRTLCRPDRGQTESNLSSLSLQEGRDREQESPFAEERVGMEEGGGGPRAGNGRNALALDPLTALASAAAPPASLRRRRS